MRPSHKLRIINAISQSCGAYENCEKNINNGVCDICEVNRILDRVINELSAIHKEQKATK